MASPVGRNDVSSRGLFPLSTIAVRCRFRLLAVEKADAGAAPRSQRSSFAEVSTIARMKCR